MILSDNEIRIELASGLVWDAVVRDEQIQPASLELSLGWDDAPGREFLSIVLDPGEFRLAHTLEKVSIPIHLVAQLNGKSSLARLGLTIHQTGGYIDPGFTGQIVLELHNVSAAPIRLDWGMPICQLVLHRLTSPASRPYGHAGLGSHYQGQTGDTPSALASALAVSPVRAAGRG